MTAQEITDYEAAERDQYLSSAITVLLDGDRLASALVWVILDTYAQTTPATKAKYDTARTKIITAYKTQPWKV